MAEPATVAAANKATLLRVVDKLNAGDLDFIDEVFSPDFTFYSPTSPIWPRGLHGARQMVTQLRTSTRVLRTSLPKEIRLPYGGPSAVCIRERSGQEHQRQASRV
jgi:ketosteroid isomerase-like protein